MAAVTGGGQAGRPEAGGRGQEAVAARGTGGTEVRAGGGGQGWQAEKYEH